MFKALHASRDSNTCRSYQIKKKNTYAYYQTSSRLLVSILLCWFLSWVRRPEHHSFIPRPSLTPYSESRLSRCRPVAARLPLPRAPSYCSIEGTLVRCALGTYEYYVVCSSSQRASFRPGGRTSVMEYVFLGLISRSSGLPTREMLQALHTLTVSCRYSE
ncbi:hypothetical protein EDB81DRAFT_793289 [Dactylonectria macrodidyma]|uniref:Uncharacterized protein n=1 Tax=Dactylonectria macrodidyma TaxID=307937 RepID=A0A9P9J7X1_9HYPO|nr:hypothetical protein EDB81DRAFT_793289 [Dactylonectria macrodidyma]